MTPGVMTGDTAARMDRMYRYQRHIYDATRKFYLLGRDGLIERMSLLPGDRVVEIGCGTGRNLVALARRYPGVHLYGIDASAVMLRSAAAHIRRAGLEGRIRLAYGLGEQLDGRAMFGLERPFDSALISYALTMIPAWPQVIERAMTQLRPAGRLAVVDFWDQEGLPHWFRQALQRWLALFDVHPQREMPEFFERLARDRGGSVIIDSLLGRYAFRLIYQAPA